MFYAVGVRSLVLIDGHPAKTSRQYIAHLKGLCVVNCLFVFSVSQRCYIFVLFYHTCSLMHFSAASFRGRHYLGGPEYTCTYCKAVFWFNERCVQTSSFHKRKMFSNHCCKGGRVRLEPYRRWPAPLDRLIGFGGGAESSAFMRSIRSYNSMFAFSSLGVKVDDSINTGRGPYVFRVNGLPVHRIGSLVPAPNKSPKFAQLYIYDTANEIDHRLAVFDGAGNGGGEGGSGGGPDRDIVVSLTAMLNDCNALVKQFRMIRVSRERVELAAAPFSIRIVGSASDDPRVYSPPTAPELAALIVGDLDADRCKFDIVVELEEGPLKRISPLHPALMSLQYPLLFPYGDKGFHLGIRYIETEDVLAGGRSEVSMLEYYAYQCRYRKGHTNPYLCCGRLSQQACVDAYACVESNRLSFILKNQDKLRSETYQGITDAVGQGSATGRSVGVKVVLPSGFIGSKRYMAQNYQDAMAICRCYGAPDLFVTFTCNPKWDEVADALRFEPGQKPADRPDIVSRVFKMKLDQLYSEVKDGTAFGKTRAGAFLFICVSRSLFY